jgi:hypothetical protein
VFVERTGIICIVPLDEPAVIMTVNSQARRQAQGGSRPHLRTGEFNIYGTAYFTRHLL